LTIEVIATGLIESGGVAGPPATTRS
jgi:hypothetical protein